MKITEVNSYSDFISMREMWAHLLRRCNHTVFSTWEWLSIWWKHFGRDKRLVLLLAEDNGKMLGAAPLMHSVDKMLGLPVSKIEFIGTPNSDYNNFVIADKSEECIKLFIDYLLNNLSGKWDSIDLKDIPETAQSVLFLKRISGGAELVSSRALHYCLYVPLPRSYETLYNQLSYKFRQNLRRCQTHLQQRYRVEFGDYSTTQLCDEGMKNLFDLHQKRWKPTGQLGVFANQKICDFNLDIARSFSKLGWLGLNCLIANDVPIASSYGFRYNSKFYYYLHGVDPDYYRYSTGNLLVVGLIKKCIEESLTEFDFLRGDERYKYRWTSLGRKNLNMVLTKSRYSSRVQNWLARQYWFQGKRLKRILKLE